MVAVGLGVRQHSGECGTEFQNVVPETATQAGEVHGWWGHVVRYPKTPAGTALVCRGPHWWSVVQTLAATPGAVAIDRDILSRQTWRRISFVHTCHFQRRG